MCSSRSLALDRPRHTALRYPAVLSNRANTYRLRRQPAPIHAPFRSRTTSAIAPPTVSHGARGTQIPITHAAPPTCPFPRFPPLEVCGRRPSETAALSLIGPASENLHITGLMQCSNKDSYSITSSARARSPAGRVTPRDFAVLRLAADHNLVGNSMGRSPGRAPFRILSTK